MEYSAAAVPLPVSAEVQHVEAAVMPPAEGEMQQQEQGEAQAVQPAPAETNGVQREAGASGSEGTQAQKGRFKPIDLDSLSPKSKQRVVRNRQAATRSKAKKKEEFNALKMRKDAMAQELANHEQHAQAVTLRIAALQAENKSLLDACKCPKQ